MAERNIISELIDFVTSDVNPVDEEERYDSILSELYDRELPDCLSGLSVPGILKEMRPTDYRCGMNDFFGTDDQLYDIGGSYYDRDDVDAARDRFIEELEGELSDLEVDVAEGMQTDGCDVDDHEDVIELRELIDKAKRYVF